MSPGTEHPLCPEDSLGIPFPLKEIGLLGERLILGVCGLGGSVMGLGILSHQIAVEANDVTGVSRGLRG